MTKYIFILVLTALCSSCNDFSQANQRQYKQLSQNLHHATTENEVDQLFAQLKVATEEKVIRQTQQRIRKLWAKHPDARIDTLMEAGTDAMYSKDYEDALNIFSSVININPGYAEGWNKRATVYFMMGNFQASLRDIRNTLDLEQRHFGALSGMASIYLVQGKNEKALVAYERLHKIIPQLKEVNLTIQELRGMLGYRRI